MFIEILFLFLTSANLRYFFYSIDIELIKFWENRGFRFTVDGNLEHYKEGNRMREEGMPAWPEEGSIVQTDGYIIVNLDNYEGS